VPPLRRGVCHTVPDPESAVTYVRRGFRGKSKESQRALEGPAGRAAHVPAEGLLAFDRSTAFSRRLHNGNRDLHRYGWGCRVGGEVREITQLLG